MAFSLSFLLDAQNSSLHRVHLVAKVVNVGLNIRSLVRTQIEIDRLSIVHVVVLVLGLGTGTAESSRAAIY